MARKAKVVLFEQKIAKAEEPVSSFEAPKFTPCRQCGYPADCERAAKCRKGFK